MISADGLGGFLGGLEVFLGASGRAWRAPGWSLGVHGVSQETLEVSDFLGHPGGGLGALGCSSGVFCGPREVSGGSMGDPPTALPFVHGEIVMFPRGRWGPVNSLKVHSGSAMDQTW